MHNAGESGTVDCAWVNVGWHCVSEGESKEPTVEINGMLRGPGLSCSVTSVGFRGRVPEPGRLETLEVVFFFIFFLKFGAQMSKIIVLSGFPYSWGLQAILLY